MTNKWDNIYEEICNVYSIYHTSGGPCFDQGTSVDGVVNFIRKRIEGELNTVDNLRKSYFAFRDTFHHNGNSGLSKVEIHELAKKYIFPKLIEDKDNFIDGGKDQVELSVTWLSHKGWQSFIEEFKLFCAENYNYYL